MECSDMGRYKKIPSRTGSMQGADQAPKKLSTGHLIWAFDSWMMRGTTKTAPVKTGAAWVSLRCESRFTFRKPPV